MLLLKKSPLAKYLIPAELKPKTPPLLKKNSTPQAVVINSSTVTPPSPTVAETKGQKPTTAGPIAFSFNPKKAKKKQSAEQQPNQTNSNSEQQ